MSQDVRKLWKLKEDHVQHGHSYLEYMKFACEPTCDPCKQEGCTEGVPVKWFPVPTLSESTALPQRYVSYLLIWRVTREMMTSTGFFQVCKLRKCLTLGNWHLLSFELVGINEKKKSSVAFGKYSCFCHKLFFSKALISRDRLFCSPKSL